MVLVPNVVDSRATDEIKPGICTEFRAGCNETTVQFDDKKPPELDKGTLGFLENMFFAEKKTPAAATTGRTKLGFHKILFLA